MRPCHHVRASGFVKSIIAASAWKFEKNRYGLPGGRLGDVALLDGLVEVLGAVGADLVHADERAEVQDRLDPALLQLADELAQQVAREELPALDAVRVERQLVLVDLLEVVADLGLVVARVVARVADRAVELGSDRPGRRDADGVR
jgi:hypothetical protein